MTYIFKNIIFIFLMSAIFPFQRGNIISIEEIEYESLEQIQINIDNELGALGLEALYGATMYKIIYETVDGFGDSTAASGVMAIPEGENEAFGLLSWQHGTQIYQMGVQSNLGFDILSRAVAASGFVYVAADYLGLGESEGLHPYIMKYPTANSVIDLIRAVINYYSEDSQQALNGQLTLIGYSEGGYATLATQMIMEEEMADEFEITVSFPMAGPYDLSGIMADEMLEGIVYPQPYYIPYILYSYVHYYEIGSLTDYFVPEFATDIANLYSGDFDGGYINTYMNNNGYNPPIQCMLPEVVQDFENDDNHILRQLLEENDLYDWAPQSLTYLFHGVADELVPVENSQIAYDTFIANGSENVYIELLPDTFGGHAEAAPFAVLTAYTIGQQLQMINPLGDVNQDETIDILDIIQSVDIIMAFTSGIDDYMLWAGNLNNDSIIDILDILLMVNIILSQPE